MVNLQVSCDGRNPTKSTSEWLEQVQNLVELVTPEAALVKIFSGRWTVIRRKLDMLSEHISKLQEISDSASINSTLCNELLQNIFKNLMETKDLSERCLEEAYGGKLQMQSSLDGLAMKLGQHLQEFELLLKSGVVRESTPRGNLTNGVSSKETLKWTVRDLLTRLQIGSLESKQKAVANLLELMNEDDKSILVVADEGGVQTLVHILDSGPSCLREKAASAVHRLVQIESCEHLLVSEGAVTPLVRILEFGSPHTKEKAATILKELTSNPENVRTVLVQGGVPALLETCRIGTPAAQAAAAGTIRNLTFLSEGKRNLVEEGAISLLIGLTNSGTPFAQESACEALWNLCSCDESLRQAVVRESAIQALMLFYDNTRTVKGKEVAMGALDSIAASSCNVEELISAGFISRIVTSLNSSNFVEQEYAASAVCHLSRSSELRKVLGDSGCIPSLVKMLEGKLSSTQEMAARGISSLISIDSNLKAFCKEEKSIPKIVSLLDPSSQGINTKFPILVLLCLAQKKKCRKEMIAAGACAYLSKLAEMEVPGSKKLIERLQGNKMWNLFRT